MIMMRGVDMLDICRRDKSVGKMLFERRGTMFSRAISLCRNKRGHDRRRHLAGATEQNFVQSPRRLKLPMPTTPKADHHFEPQMMASYENGAYILRHFAVQSPLLSIRRFHTIRLHSEER